jgi:carboxypeptidase T
MKTTIFIVLILTFCLFSYPGSQAKPEKYIISMEINDYKATLEANGPLDPLYYKDNRVYFLIDQSDLNGIPREKIKSMEKAETGKFPGAGNDKAGDLNGLYHNYAETESFLLDLAERFPNLATVFSAGQSIEGRELFVIKISDNVETDEDEPNIFIVGCHHAREWLSVEIPLLFAQHLLTHYSDNSTAQKIVNGAQIYIMPIQNPDGLEYSIHHYFYWRKNRRYNGDFCWGVDTNRNYGYMWGYADDGSSPDPTSEVYRGPYPFSEPETAAVRDFLLTHPPAGTLSYHNFSQSILFPWSYTTDLTPDDEDMRAIAKKMQELIFAVNGRTYRYGTGSEILYTSNGDTIDWVYGTFATPGYTIELPNESFFLGGFFTSEAEIDMTFRENLPAMLYFASTIIDKSE